MEREKYFECLIIMTELDGQWYRDREGLYQFYKPEEMSSEAIEAAKMLNENYVAATEEWNRYLEMYEHNSFEDEYDDEDDENN